MSESRSFFAELQRRHVYKVGAAYCVAGWLLVQIATQVFPFFDISNVAVRWVVIAVVAGLPVALVLAWLFDLTPEGIVRTPDLPAGGEAKGAVAQRRSMDRKLNYLLGGLLVLGAAYVVADRAGVFRAKANTGLSEAVAGGGDKSIAVLPFENLSDDKTNGYFAEGIQDEILTRLAKVGSLRVISRTSTLRYASAPDNLAAVGKALGVANLVEGSVQKSGQKVRINVQLIHADNDTHLLAETYDRTLDDVFSVQGEVAGAIADALDARLSGGARAEVTAIPTKVPQAYDAYLRGIAEYGRGFRQEGFQASIRAFHEAVKADPGFGQAWAMLARSESLMILFGYDTTEDRRRSVLRSVETAERTIPNTLESLSARAYYTYRVERDLDRAQQQFESILQRWPNDAEAMTVLSYIAERRGRFAESDTYVEKALKLDPLNVQYHKLLVLNKVNRRLFDQAEVSLRNLQALDPDDSEARNIQAIVCLGKGDLPCVERQFDSKDMKFSDETIHFELARLRRDYPPAIVWLRELIDHHSQEVAGNYVISARLDLADLLRLSGDAPAAAALYEQARQSIQELLQKEPDNWPLHNLLAFAEAGLGHEQEAFAALDRAENLLPESRDHLFAPVVFEYRARFAARFGHSDAALAALRHVLSETYASSYGPPLCAAILKLDPDFDRLRGDPRFQQLVVESGEKAAP